MNKKFLLAVAVSTLMSGCATMFTDDQVTLNVLTSNNEAATVMVDGKEFSVPGPVTVEKDGSNKILITKTDGCVNQTVLNRKIENSFWINILGVGLFGSTTDSATDKMWTYDDSVTVACKNK